MKRARNFIRGKRGKTEFELCVMDSFDYFFEQAKEALGENLLEFTLEKMVSEIVDESVENTSVIKKIVNEALFFLVINWKRTLEEVLMERCHMLIKTGQDYVGCCFTCCIGTPCSMEQLPDKADEVVNLLLRNVLESDQVFREGEAAVTSGFNTRLLDLKQMENDLRNKDRMKILNTVKTVLGKLSREKSVSVETLLVIQQEILQLIYTNLYQNGIQAAELFGDEVSRKIQRQSVRSVFDMIKWVNYAISRTLEYEDEINRSLSLADKIESYVKEHYKEDISRDTIADVFFLTPEYLAKVQKWVLTIFLIFLLYLKSIPGSHRENIADQKILKSKNITYFLKKYIMDSFIIKPRKAK